MIGSPLKSRWSYAEAKAIDESLVESYVRELGLRAVIVRFFNTVGPRQTGRYGMVIPRFVRQALAGQPLTVFGTGQQVRCFCHVHDVIPALTALIASDRACGQAVNVGSTEQVTIEGLARRVIAATGSASGIERATYLEAYGSGYEDMQRRVPDCALARGPRRLRGDQGPGRDHPGRHRGPGGGPGRRGLTPAWPGAAGPGKGRRGQRRRHCAAASGRGRPPGRPGRGGGWPARPGWAWCCSRRRWWG